nr:alanyl-tRNA editing protein [uncultured Dethiosulfovibrio sp.]
MKAVVRDIDWKEGKKLRLSLDRPCPMHPEGGGQPGDSGFLSWDGGKANVTNTLKGNHLSPILEVTLQKGELISGMEVELERDENRNCVLSRMHSAEHVLSKVMETLKPGLSVYKVAVGEERTGVYFRYDGPVDWDFAFLAEQEARAVVASAMPVEILELSVDEARSLEGLKARWERLEDEVVRVVKIPNFDLIACSGSHVSDTSQIGDICVESVKGSSPEWEIVFSLGDRFSMYSREMRRLVSRLNCSPDELGKIFDRLSEENRLLGKQLSKVAPYVELPWEESVVKGVDVSYCAPVGLPADMLSACGRKKIAQSSEVVLIICDDGGQGPVPFMLWQSDEKLDPKALLAVPDLEARGGGRGGSISGRTGCRSLERWLKAIDSVM